MNRTFTIGLMATLIGCAPAEFEDSSWEAFEDVSEAVAHDEAQAPPPGEVSVQLLTDLEPGSWVVALVQLPIAREGVDVFVPFTDQSDDLPFCPPPLAGDCLGLTGDLVHLGRATTAANGSALVGFWVPETYTDGVLGMQVVVPTSGGRLYSEPQILYTAPEVDNVGMVLQFGYVDAVPSAQPFSFGGQFSPVILGFQMYVPGNANPICTASAPFNNGIFGTTTGTQSPTTLFEFFMDGAVWQTDCDGVLRPADMAALDTLMAREWGFGVEPTVGPNTTSLLRRASLDPNDFFGLALMGEGMYDPDWAMLSAYEFDGATFELPLDPMTGAPIQVSASNLQTGGTLDTSWLYLGISWDVDELLASVL